jgi:hypothetical protein
MAGRWLTLWYLLLACLAPRASYGAAPVIQTPIALHHMSWTAREAHRKW